MHIGIHSMFVHFPLAFTLAVVILDWGRWIFDRERLLAAGFWGGSTALLVLAFLGAGASVATGLLAEEGIVTNAVIGKLLETHETLAFLVTGGLAILTFWRVALRGRFPRKASFLYLALVLLIAVLIGYGAYVGGVMVYAHGVGVDVPS